MSIFMDLICSRYKKRIDSLESMVKSLEKSLHDCNIEKLLYVKRYESLDEQLKETLNRVSQYKEEIKNLQKQLDEIREENKILFDMLHPSNSSDLIKSLRELVSYWKDKSLVERSAIWYTANRALFAYLGTKITVDTELTGDKIQDLLYRWDSTVEHQPLDWKYRIPTLEDMKKIIDSCWVHYQNYIAELFDCEDFAISFKSFCNMYYYINNVGYCIGIVEGYGGHGFNIFLVKENDNYKFYYFEPQTNTYWSKEDNERGDTPFKSKYIIRRVHL